MTSIKFISHHFDSAVIQSADLPHERSRSTNSATVFSVGPQFTWSSREGSLLPLRMNTNPGRWPGVHRTSGNVGHRTQCRSRVLKPTGMYSIMAARTIRRVQVIRILKYRFGVSPPHLIYHRSIISKVYLEVNKTWDSKSEIVHQKEWTTESKP